MRARVFTLLVCAVGSLTAAAPSSPQSLNPRDLIQSYADGSPAAARATVPRGRAVDAMLSAVRGWMAGEGAREWPFASAVMCLDLAEAAAEAGPAASPTVIELLRLGRKAITAKEAAMDVRLDRPHEKLFHQTALAVLQGIASYQEQQNYIDDISDRLSGDWPPRLWMARGLAIEQRVAAQLAKQKDQNVSAFAAPLDEATRHCDRAARDPETRAEASARAAAIFVRLGRHRDALRRLEIAGEASGDVEVAAWLAYLRAQVWTGLGDDGQARVAIEQARKLSAADPAPGFERGDARHAGEWLATLRGALSSVMTTGPTRPAVMTTVDLYEAHAYDDAIAALAPTSLEQFSKELREVADPWIRDGGPVKQQHRQYLVAALALEAARARGGLEWRHAQLLIEWACERLRAKTEPGEDDRERAWMIAAAAVMEGGAAGAVLEVHALHALKRFPNDPALTMAKAVAAELRAGPDVRTAQGTKAPTTTSMFMAASAASSIQQTTPTTVGTFSPTTDVPTDISSGPALDLAVRRFNEMASIDPYRDEAKLRLGYTSLRRGKHEDALEHLVGPAKNTTDVFIAYLAHLFRGRALERLKRWDQAVVEYRAAVAVQPGAQTAELALAAALARSGRRAEAAELADRALMRTDAPFDPWLGYGQGDFRHWARLIAGVRKAIP